MKASSAASLTSFVREKKNETFAFFVSVLQMTAVESHFDFRHVANLGRSKYASAPILSGSSGFSSNSISASEHMLSRAPRIFSRA